MFRSMFQRVSGMVSHLRQRFQKSSGKPASSGKLALKIQPAKGARSNGRRPMKRKKTPVRAVKKS
jgi:hypothetical protein